jgi:serine phosphatase RsbU (regulator of sigma subunit)
MQSQYKILVVDDDPLMRRMLGRALARLGFSVEECSDGVEAFRILEALHGKALLVLDYAMPKFNGAQVCEIIRTHADPEIAQTPIILVTAHTGELHELECLRAGADDFVSKPVNVPVLKARIETHFRLASLRGQLRAQNRELEQWRAIHERDLEAARLIQQAILPLTLPPVKGWEFASRYQSLIQVGGDIFDSLGLPGGGQLIWIADATGHGVSAALLTTFTKLLFRHASVEAREPGRIIECVNRDFHAIFKGTSFLTAACVVLRPGEGDVTVAGAGHPPVLVVRRDGRVEPLFSSAPPVGLMEAGPPDQLSAFLAVGDALLLFTDGLYGVTNPEGVHLSYERFVKQLRGHPTQSARALIDLAIAQASEFAQGRQFDDDVALVALRRV